ncbi:MAG: rhodanese-like domain-containing protein [Labilithrix sp.]|nr:rhodanese-like domain-containing protein [Labilithrix sp.]MCW5812485.1 rhodanese-like domain-containing protein [Labilithrix sp.]
MDSSSHLPLIPPIGSVSQAERMFRVNWVANVKSTPSGVPFVTADFVAKQGRKVRVVDVRSAEELVGPLGHVPGSDWIPLARIPSLVDRVDRDTPIIIVSGGEERSYGAVAALAKAGMRFVAFMGGGIMSWRDLGYSTTRDTSILEREDKLHEVDESQEAPTSVTVDDVRRHVGDRHTVRWIKLPALLVRGLVSCVDGRDDSGVIGSPGGDAGEMLIGLRALEKTMLRDLTEDEVRTLLLRRLDVFGRFYMHTDIAAGNAMVKTLRADSRFVDALKDVNETLEWRKFMAAPPPALRGALAEHLLTPSHIGCGHLRLALTKAPEYDLRESLVTALLRGFHEKRWEGAPELELVALAGGHTERAVLLVRMAGPLHTFSRIPLVSPAVYGAQVFVHHPRVTSYLRKQLAHFLAAQHDICGPVDPEELHIAMERLGSVQLGQTLTALAKGLPIFEVTFQDEDKFEVRSVGQV